MSASTETSFRRLSTPSAAAGLAGFLGALAPRLRFSSRRQRVGAITVWDGQAGFRLPAPGRSCFRLGLYVTFRRGPDDDNPETDPPAGAAARSSPAAQHRGG